MTSVRNIRIRSFSSNRGVFESWLDASTWHSCSMIPHSSNLLCSIGIWPPLHRNQL